MDDFLCVIGIYVFTPGIFDVLGDMVAKYAEGEGEVQLTTAIQKQIRNEGVYGYLVQGKHYDIGLPDSYRRTVKEFGVKGSGGDGI